MNWVCVWVCVCVVKLSWKFIDSIQPLKCSSKFLSPFLHINVFQWLFNRTKSNFANSKSSKMHSIYDYQTVCFRSGSMNAMDFSQVCTIELPSLHFINIDATKIIILLIFNTESIKRVRNVLINRYYLAKREHCNQMCGCIHIHWTCAWIQCVLNNTSAHITSVCSTFNVADLIDWGKQPCFLCALIHFKLKSQFKIAHH